MVTTRQDPSVACRCPFRWSGLETVTNRGWYSSIVVSCSQNKMITMGGYDLLRVAIIFYCKKCSRIDANSQQQKEISFTRLVGDWDWMTTAHGTFMLESLLMLSPNSIFLDWLACISNNFPCCLDNIKKSYMSSRIVMDVKFGKKSTRVYTFNFTGFQFYWSRRRDYYSYVVNGWHETHLRQTASMRQVQESVHAEFHSFSQWEDLELAINSSFSSMIINSLTIAPHFTCAREHGLLFGRLPVFSACSRNRTRILCYEGWWPHQFGHI